MISKSEIFHKTHNLSYRNNNNKLQLFPYKDSKDSFSLFHYAFISLESRYPNRYGPQTDMRKRTNS